MSLPRMKLHWANWALRIFLFKRQPESRSASAMIPASVNCLQTWGAEVLFINIWLKSIWRFWMLQFMVYIPMIVLKCGWVREVEDLPSWHIPHRRGWQALTSPDVERATEAWWEDRQATLTIFTMMYWCKDRNITKSASNLYGVGIFKLFKRYIMVKILLTLQWSFLALKILINFSNKQHFLNDSLKCNSN